MGVDKTAQDKELLAMSEISLILDGYDDIFSDFDPRPYSQKSLSQDFLEEAKRASKDKAEGLELQLMVPKKARDISLEENIKKRLRDHFKRHHDMLHNEIKNFRNHGFVFLLAGIAMMTLAYFFSVDGGLLAPNMLNNLLFIILEPAGWFTAYTGLERIFNIPAQKTEEAGFYGKMASSHITFKGY